MWGLESCLMDHDRAERIELAVRTRLHDSLIAEFGNLSEGIKRLDLPRSKTYRHLDPAGKDSTKKIPLTDVSVIAQRLHEYDPERFPTFGALFDAALSESI